MKTFQRSLAPLVLCLILASCAGTTTSTTGTTPPVPTPPQITVANGVATLASGSDAAAHACATGYSNGTISQADFNACKSVITALATAGKQIDAEQNSTDTWTVQKSKIVTILTNTGLAQITSRVSPNVALLISAIVTTANAISVAVGGPTL